MNITSATGAASAAQVRTNGVRSRPDDTKMLSPVADKLGMSVSDLKTAMQNGTTLDSLATSKGVSHADLVGAIKEGLVAGKPSDAPELSTAQLDEMAESMATGAMSGPGGAGGPGGADGAGRPMGPPPPRHGENQADSTTLDSVATLLEMSTTDLLESLTSGTSLSQLAKDQGISADALLDAISSGMVVDTTA